MFGFVTGASSGMGEAFACRLAADGWDLAITARRGDRLRVLAKQLAGEHGVKVKTCVADLTDPGDLAELEQMAAAAEPDLLVNVAVQKLAARASKIALSIFPHSAFPVASQSLE